MNRTKSKVKDEKVLPLPMFKTAQQHEAEMRAKLVNSSFVPPSAAQSKLIVSEYMSEWIELHGKANLRPSTFAGYKIHLKNHILQYHTAEMI